MEFWHGFVKGIVDNQVTYLRADDIGCFPGSLSEIYRSQRRNLKGNLDKIENDDTGFDDNLRDHSRHAWLN